MTEEEIQRLSEALKGITPLPWKVLVGVPPYGSRDDVFVGTNGVALWDDRGAMDNRVDAHAIAAIMNAAPRLLATLQSERKARQQAEERAAKAEAWLSTEPCCYRMQAGAKRFCEVHGDDEATR